MNKILISIVLIVTTAFSCSGGQKEKPSALTSVNGNSKHSIVIPVDSGGIRLNLMNGQGTLRTQKKKNQTICIEFISTGYKKVSAHLSSPDPQANIRFSQIFIPDGTMDGPWGRDMEYALAGDGLYKLSIHENMMAGDPWSGIFDVNIKLEK